jgi:hypothetical protein
VDSLDSFDGRVDVDDPLRRIIRIVDVSIANGPFLDRAGILAGAVGYDVEDRDYIYRYTRDTRIRDADENVKYRYTTVKLSDISKRDGTTQTLLTSENTQRGFWISPDIIHFYTDRSGNPLSANQPFFTLPDQRTAVSLTGFGLLGSTIEGSVAFCWPRAAYENGRIRYSPVGFVKTLSDPEQELYDSPFDRIPCYVTRFYEKTFEGSWYQSARPASYHAVLVVAAFCDGNVRRINYDIDEHVFVQLMTVSDAQSDAGWKTDTPENLLYDRLFDGSVLGRQ